MREFVAVLVAINGIGAGLYMLRERSIDWKGFLAISVVVLALAVIIPNMQRVTQLNFKGQSVGEITLHIDQKAQEVETRAEEVKKLAGEVSQMREEMTLLLQNANNTNDKIADSEKRVMTLVNRADATEVSIKKIKVDVDGTLKMAESVQSAVAKMESNVRGMFRSLFESFAYAIMTRNIFPTPQPIAVKIDQHLNRIAEFAIPDAAERQTLFQEIVADVQSARPQIPQRQRPNQGK